MPTSRQETDAVQAAFEVLSNPRRRYAIEYLHQVDEQRVRLRDMAERLAAWENEISPQAVDYKQRKRVYTSLYQTHLPKLDRTGVVEYDRNAGLIRPTAAVEELYAYIHPAATTSRRWERLGVVTSTLCLAVVGAVGSGVLPFSGSGYRIAVLVSIVFVLVSAAQYADAEFGR